MSNSMYEWRMGRFALTLIALVGFAPLQAAAEIDVIVYVGAQTANDSRVSGNDPGGAGDFSANMRWDGKSGEAPPYYGFRATWWRSENWGFAFDFNHAKVYADPAIRDDLGFQRLELTDGLNLVTINLQRRWQNDSRSWEPYLGVGIGVSVPHVDVESAGGKTFGYQYTGPAVVWNGGIAWSFAGQWQALVEYKGSFSQNEADLDNGGFLDTDITTHALNLGIGYRF